MTSTYKRQRVPSRSPSSHSCMLLHHQSTCRYPSRVPSQSWTSLSSISAPRRPLSPQLVLRVSEPLLCYIRVYIYTYIYIPLPLSYWHSADPLLSHRARPDGRWHNRRRPTRGRPRRITERLGCGGSCSGETTTTTKTRTRYPARHPRPRRTQNGPASGRRRSYRAYLALAPSRGSSRSCETSSSR